MAKVIPLHRKSMAEIGCTACGATVDAACDCGAPYMPASQRAADAIAENPKMSNRAIAEEAGISEPTVRRARTASRDAVDERVGLDGKVRRMPRRASVDDDDDQTEVIPPTPEEHRVAFLIFSNEAMLLAKYNGPIDEEVLAAARATATAWCRLVSTMEKAE